MWKGNKQNWVYNNVLFTALFVYKYCMNQRHCHKLFDWAQRPDLRPSTSFPQPVMDIQWREDMFCLMYLLLPHLLCSKGLTILALTMWVALYMSLPSSVSPLSPHARETFLNSDQLNSWPYQWRQLSVDIQDSKESKFNLPSQNYPLHPFSAHTRMSNTS